MNALDFDTPPVEAGVADDLTLVALIHDGIFEPQPWSRFLRALRGRLAAGYANVIFRRPGSDDGLVEWSDADGHAAAEIRAAYYRSFAGLDPFPYFDMQPGRVLRLPELMGVGDYREHPYFIDFLKPNGLEHMLLFRAVEPHGHQAWVTVTQPLDRRDFSRQAADLCTVLASHFAIALRCYAQLGGARITREIQDRVMRKLNFACVIVDAQRFVVRRDEGSDRVLQAGRPIAVDAAGKVRLASASADRDLGILLAKIGGGILVGPQAIVSDADERLDILVVALEPSIIGATAAVATLYFQLEARAHPTGEDREGRFRELFGLSATEARLAHGLADGLTLTEAASASSITVESARTYSKRIFAKTGTARQADLVRVLLTSVAALA